MLLFSNYSIVFQEVPGEVSLAINLSACPNRCPGCHSPQLQERIGTPLTEDILRGWPDCYANAITCVCFLGGDADPFEIERLAFYIQNFTQAFHGKGRLKTCWYSGKSNLPKDFNLNCLNYLKLGPYLYEKGGLDSPIGNQRFFRIERNNQLTDLTYLFWKVKT